MEGNHNAEPNTYWHDCVLDNVFLNPDYYVPAGVEYRADCPGFPVYFPDPRERKGAHWVPRGQMKGVYVSNG